MKDYPEHVKGNTSLIWMQERLEGNKDWPLEGLIYIVTDETGRYKDIQIKKAFEIHDQGNQIIVLHHPKYAPLDLERKLKQTILEKYDELNQEY